jgi:hypothetical protein
MKIDFILFAHKLIPIEQLKLTIFEMVFEGTKVNRRIYIFYV